MSTSLKANRLGAVFRSTSEELIRSNVFDKNAMDAGIGETRVGDVHRVLALF